MVLCSPDGDCVASADGVSWGEILHKPAYAGGGFESLLWIREAGCSYGEMNPAQLSRLGSRGKAARALANELKRHLPALRRVRRQRTRASINHLNGPHRRSCGLFDIALTTANVRRPKAPTALTSTSVMLATSRLVCRDQHIAGRFGLKDEHAHPGLNH